MNQDTTSTQTAAPAKLQANVDYLPGITIAGSRNALLEWSADDRIKLFAMDETGVKSEEVLFDVSLGEIERVSGSLNMLTFLIAGKKYNALFSRTAALKLGIGGGIGLGAAYKDVQKTGIQFWIDKFRENNVNLKGFRDASWIVKVALLITVVSIGVALLVATIVAVIAVVAA